MKTDYSNITLNSDEFLEHFGVPGMRWGQRIARSGGPLMIGSKRTIKKDEALVKRLDEGKHLSIGFTKKRQAKYDERDRKILTAQKKRAENKLEKRAEKKQARIDKKMDKILNSPSKLLKNKSKFSEAQIEAAMKTMRLDRELRGLSRDKLSSNAQLAQSVLSYGTVAVTAYGLYNSPVVQGIRKAFE